MIVGMWMTRNVESIDPGESITAAATLMASRRIRRLPVIERRSDGSHLIGIVTSKDLYRAYPRDVNPFGLMAAEMYQSDITVMQVMKREPLTTTPGAPIEDPARTMRDRKIGGIPVLEKGVLVGIITESDIFRAFLEMLESPHGSVRITFNMAMGEDIFGLIHRLASPRKVKVLSLISTQHDDTPVCVVRLAGGELDAFLDDLWESGHLVLNVLRIP